MAAPLQITGCIYPKKRTIIRAKMRHDGVTLGVRNMQEADNQVRA